jgi:uncharacterized protein (TIGR02598 family)
MKTRNEKVSRSHKLHGFSLVEVTLAIGITAVALVSLMGMIPKGMKTLQKATDEAVTGRIHQQIMGELQLTPWESTGGSGSALEGFDGEVRYYDDQGIEVTESDRNSNPQLHVYTARISLPKSGAGLPESVGGGTHGGVNLPGEHQATSAWMRLVVVEVTSSQDPKFIGNPKQGFDSVLKPNMIYSYRTIITKMGQNSKS